MSAASEADIDSPLMVGLYREFADAHVIARFTVEGEPTSKSRARWDARRGGRPYTPANVKAAEHKVAWAYRAAVPGRAEVRADRNFGVFMAFFCGSGQRRDVDNMTKLVFDALNAVAWADDSQVTEMGAKLRRWDPDPRTEVVIYETPRQTPPTRACEHCGSHFQAYPSQKDSRRYCNRECGVAARRAARAKTCPQCGEEFFPKPSKVAAGQVHCSNACKQAFHGDILVHLTCETCGEQFTRRRSVAARGANKTCSVECRNRRNAARKVSGT